MMAFCFTNIHQFRFHLWMIDIARVRREKEKTRGIYWGEEVEENELELGCGRTQSWQRHENWELNERIALIKCKQAKHMVKKCLNGSKNA